MDDLILACRNDNEEEVRLLLKTVDPSCVHNTHVLYVWLRDIEHANIMQLLLEDGRADPSGDKNYAIGAAAYYGREEVAKILLADPRVNPADNRNYAIRWASENGHEGMVRILLEDGRVDPSDWEHLSIRRAAEKGHEVILKLLLECPKVAPIKRGSLNFWATTREQPGYWDLLARLAPSKIVTPATTVERVIVSGCFCTNGRGHVCLVEK